MRLLLDTHIFLWFISGSSQLAAALRDDIRNPENDIYLSVVSVWECIIKSQLGKLCRSCLGNGMRISISATRQRVVGWPRSTQESN